MYPALFLLPLQMLIRYTLPNPNGFSKSNFLATIFHFSVDFLCLTHIRASGAFGTFRLQPVQGKSSSVWVRGGSAGSLACGCLPCPLSVMWVSPRPGLVPWRLCPILGVGVGLGGFRLPQKWLSWSWQQLNGAAYSLKLNEVSNQTSVSGDLSHHKSSVSRHAHLQRWPGAFSARCYGSTELHQGRWT